MATTGLQGLAGLASGLPGLPQISNPFSASTTTATETASTFRTLDLWPHLLLTGLAPGFSEIPYIGPIIFSFFNILGANGTNLLVTNSMAWAAFKAVFNIVCTQIGVVLNLAYPRKLWAKFLGIIFTHFNPWMIFDWIQVVGALMNQNDPFKHLGYKIPFFNTQTDSKLKFPINQSKLTNKSIGYQTLDADKNPKLDEKGNPVISYGYFSNTAIAAVILMFSLSISSMISKLPPEMVSNISPTVKSVFSYIAIGTAAIGGTLGTTGLIALIPQVMKYINPPAAAVGPVAPAPTPVVAPVAPVVAPAAPAPMSGGGTNIPTVKEIAESLLNKSQPVQEGGAKEESAAFMGILGFLIFGGVTLAFVRRQINDSN